MRIGFLGPAGDQLGLLERAASFLLSRERVTRAVYLGDDGALDRCVVGWARRLVGDDPTDDAAWRRASEMAVSGTAAQIDRFVAGERERLRLRALVTLPEEMPFAFETLGELGVAMAYDPTLLDEEDLAHANLLVMGDSDEPRLEEAGARWLLAPGRIGRRGGVAVLDVQKEPAVVTVYDLDEREIIRAELSAPRTHAGHRAP